MDYLPEQIISLQLKLMLQIMMEKNFQVLNIPLFPQQHIFPMFPDSKLVTYLQARLSFHGIKLAELRDILSINIIMQIRNG